MREQLPQFVPAKSKQAMPGDLLYVWDIAKGLRCYVRLQINQKSYEDSFTVELACSTSDFPFTHAALGTSPQKDGSVRFRLPQLYRKEWHSKTAWEPQWWIGPPPVPQEVTAKAVERAVAGNLRLIDEGIPIEQALPLVETQVRDAIDRLQRFGIPFFEQYLRDS